jgi:hypothetical protein
LPAGNEKRDPLFPAMGRVPGRMLPIPGFLVLHA